MEFHFEELNGAFEESVRQHMISEFEQDLDEQRVYRSRRLTDDGWARWPELLREALRNKTPMWLAGRIEGEGLLKVHVDGRRVPYNAAVTLAEGEFNRFYCRGVCLVAIDGSRSVEVYRGKDVMAPRLRSQLLVGVICDPSNILEDLRRNVGGDLIKGVPGGPNSGVTLRLGESNRRTG